MSQFQFPDRFQLGGGNPRASHWGSPLPTLGYRLAASPLQGASVRGMNPTHLGGHYTPVGQAAGNYQVKIPIFKVQTAWHLICHWIIVWLLVLPIHGALASEKKPWGVEFQTGFWMPTDGNTERFFDKCCNMKFDLEGGYYVKSKWGVLVGGGFFSKEGRALGSSSGRASGDKFTLVLVPMQTSLVFHGDFKKKQPVVPFAKGGVDYVYFREKASGKSTRGLKMGLHGGGGLQILLDALDPSGEGFGGAEFDDVYLTLEAEYGWINGFGSRGLDLSGPVYSAGLLVEF